MKVTIDANIWLAAADVDEPAHDVCVACLRQVLLRKARLEHPWLLLVEVSATVARKTRNPSLAEEAVAVVQAVPGQVWHSLDAGLARTAGQLAAQLALRSADAVYAAVAKHSGAVLLTCDVEMQTRAAGAIACLSPAEWLAGIRDRI
jgi:predicted nucleic acid-binding protein